jgi:hypothetical protein
MFRWTKIQAFDVGRVVFSYVPVGWVIFVAVFLIILELLAKLVLLI